MTRSAAHCIAGFCNISVICTEQFLHNYLSDLSAPISPTHVHPLSIKTRLYHIQPFLVMDIVYVPE